MPCSVISTVPLFNAGVSVMRNPACLISKNADRADTRLKSEIKPMLGVGRYSQKITGTASDRKHVCVRCVRVKPKETFPFDEEPHFIFAVGMFAEKLLPNGWQVGSCGRDPDHIGGAVAVLFHEW